MYLYFLFAYCVLLWFLFSCGHCNIIKETMNATEQILGEFGDGRVVKMLADMSKEVQQVKMEADRLILEEMFLTALEKLCDLERRTRLSADMNSNATVQVWIVSVCFNERQYDILNEQIIALSKKRSLMKYANSKMVRACVDSMPSVACKTAKLKLIETLRKTTEGKIYVEVERARLTHMLSKMKEEDGDIDGAVKVLLELQVLLKKKKTYIFYFSNFYFYFMLNLVVQWKNRRKYSSCWSSCACAYCEMILCVRRSLRKRFLLDFSKHQDLKFKYYKLMILLDLYNKNYVGVSNHYYNLSETEAYLDKAKIVTFLKNAVVYAILAPYSEEQWATMCRVSEDSNFDQIPKYKELVQLFIKEEIISWKKDILGVYDKLKAWNASSTDYVEEYVESEEHVLANLEQLQCRVGEHNMRIVSKYYSRIYLNRIAELVDWNAEKTEEFLCKLIVNGTIPLAKICRPSGVVNFVPKKKSEEELDDWAVGTVDVMEKINKVTHLILKERMMYKNVHSFCEEEDSEEEDWFTDTLFKRQSSEYDDYFDDPDENTEDIYVEMDESLSESMSESELKAIESEMKSSIELDKISDVEVVFDRPFFKFLLRQTYFVYLNALIRFDY
ncbi:26S proteasome non-ATPase regulatory subunit 12 [Trichinella papuae]|uniref:26S proteasome non-ATPase regulatory subunit 12 n=1 Tax=Trichinella papuae TaxID=268474 RepID=A0A0V1MJX4_9BILA|nr:26S proteasome non-ATPase regulatory subunit 12 [Trichinella papuae]